MDLVILDAYNLLFRSFTSLPSAITAGDGKPINAVYGMLAFVLRLTREMAPTHIVAAFDTPDVPTFRHELYPAYQGHRGPLGGDDGPDFARQVSIAQDLLPRVGIPAAHRPGYEADDVMGTLGIAHSGAGRSVLLVSTDRDLLQLVRPGLAVMHPGKNPTVIQSDDDVRARIGVPPAGVTTFKALAGDASDHIPGLPGIGPKTAIGLIDTYSTLESIYEHLDDITPRVARVLDAGRENAHLFRRVATIVTDLDLELNSQGLTALRLADDDRPRSILDRHGYGTDKADGA